MLIKIFKNKSIFEIFQSAHGYLLSKVRRARLKRIVLTSYGLNNKPREERIIVSLTSFPGRIEYVSECIKTILHQSYKPDSVVLWLAYEQFPEKERDLPQRLLDLQQYGLEIRWCSDIRSYKKLIPILMEHKNNIIVTADDDQYYDNNWLELLYNGYLDDPKCIQCHRISKAVKTNMGEWDLISGGKDIYEFPSFLNKLVGCGGVLYPPNSLYKDIDREDLFMSLCPTNDDLWFWAMGVLNGVKIKPVKNRIMWTKEVDNTKGTALSNINRKKVVLDQLNNILEYYPTLKEIFENEYKTLLTKC